jgi:ankyrin repeat protein
MQEHFNDESINWQCTLTGSNYTALHLAALNGSTHVFRMLLRKVKFNKNLIYNLLVKVAKNPYMTETILSFLKPDFRNELCRDSARDNHKDLIKIYIDKYPESANCPNEHGLTPLMNAAYYGNTEIMKLLLMVPSTDANRVNHLGLTALMFAACHGRMEIVKLLLEVPNININHADQTGETAIMKAKKNGYAGIVALLTAKLQSAKN